MRRMRGVKFFGFILVVLTLVLIIRHNPDYANVAYAYEFLYYSEGNYLRWSADDIPIDYKISNWWLPPNATEPVGAIYAGYKTWEDVTGASVSFNYQGTTSDVLPKEQDGVNMIAWNAEGFVAGSESPGTFGVMYWGWYDTSTYYFDEVDIALNIYYPWTTTGEVGKYDIQGIVTHEVGHLLGLGHSSVTTATMIAGPTFYSTHNTGDEILLRTLDPDDIAGITILYPPDYSSSGEGSGCFIATAAYGSGLAGEVRVLSDFRDRYLVTNILGRCFVGTYYRLSPPLAAFVSEKPLIKSLVRMQLKPWVKIANAVVSVRHCEER